MEYFGGGIDGVAFPSLFASFPGTSFEEQTVDLRSLIWLASQILYVHQFCWLRVVCHLVQCNSFLSRSGLNDSSQE